jgi:hypothetical protein
LLSRFRLQIYFVIAHDSLAATPAQRIATSRKP